jgi:hypothetical protein
MMGRGVGWGGVPWTDKNGKVRRLGMGMGKKIWGALRGKDATGGQDV